MYGSCFLVGCPSTMKGESRSRVKSNDDHGYVIINGIRPGPLRSAGGFKLYSFLLFLI
tara:strand:- start:328 stop:501 length:174 start_codon:yes stop_codon:yes gene_type:complete